MTDYEVLVGGEALEPAADWHLEWTDAGHGVARLRGDDRTVTVVVEGSGSDWIVTLRGRRIPVTVRTWRERVMAAAETTAAAHGGILEVRASLPGLVVAVGVAAGDEVSEGALLMTIEAMKMQNQVRAPRAGRVVELAVTSGQAVAAGATLLQLE